MYIIFWLSFTIVMSPVMQVNSSKLHTKNTKTAIGKITNKNTPKKTANYKFTKTEGKNNTCKQHAQ